MPTEEKLEFVGVKMSKNFVEAIDEVVRKGTHTTRSEYVRQAIREKMERDTPELWARIMGKINSENGVEVTEWPNYSKFNSHLKQ